MEQVSSSKKLAVVSLIVGILALTVGFSAFTATLTIQDLAVSINPQDTFNDNVRYIMTTTTCTKTGDAVITSAGTAYQHTWSGITATLTTPGDTVTCSTDIENVSTFKAFLSSITSTTPLSCAMTNPDDEMYNLSAICSRITVKVTVNGLSATITNKAPASATNPTGNKIDPNGTATSTILITYPSDAPFADAPITLTIPTVNTTFSTVD